MDSNDSKEKLQKHLELLREEYRKLQKNYNELERKYNEATATNGDLGGEFNSFVSRLVFTVATLYGRKTYSDITIKLNGDKEIPAHKFVLSARSEIWREDVLAEQNQLDWSDLDLDIGNALLRWIYTDVVDLQHDKITLGLLRVAHKFQLAALLGLCERALVALVTVRSCVRYYCVAEEVSASILLEYTSSLISTHWDDLTPDDFTHMSGPLLYKMLKNKTKFPLHAAVRLLREDVVFLCLVENTNSLSEVVNTISPEGHLPLGLALMLKSLEISQTLVQNGKADVDAYNDGCPLIVDAIKRGDGFSAEFLLDNGCEVNIAARKTGDTPLHLIATYAEKATDELTYKDMLAVGIRLIDGGARINMQNMKGYSPLHLAIISGHGDFIEKLLSKEGVDTNIRTNDDKCPLQLALMKAFRENEDESFGLAKQLMEKGANVNCVWPETGDSLLHFLIRKDEEESACFLVDTANLNSVNKSGLAPLHLACEKGFCQLTEKLLAKGAQPNIQSTIMEYNTPLHFAVQHNKPEVIKLFVEFRNSNPDQDQDHLAPNFNLKNEKTESPLTLALSVGHESLVPILIEGGADVNARNGQDLTLLHQAILKEDTNTAIFLLKNGADMNALTGDQETPLQLGISCRLPQVVDVLCTMGVSFSTPDDRGDCPLWVALDSNQEEIASVLVRHGVDTDCWSAGPENSLQTLLHRAIDENKEDIACFLIRSGCDLDSPRQPAPGYPDSDEAKTKASPLHLCCEFGLTKTLQALIDHGANVNSIDRDTKTPLHIAIENQNDEIIGILLCHPSIDLKIRDKFGNTPFAAALTIRNHKAAQNILQRIPNAAEQMDQRGRNFLHVAIMKDDLESVLFLLAIQVDVNSRVHDVNQTPPLHLSAASENEMILRNLILAGARINECDSTQKTALHIAAERGKIELVSALITNGANFDASDNDGNNALHIAVREGHLAVVRILLTESGINAEHTNLKGRNPMHELCRFGKDQIAAAICELFLESMPQYPINATDLQANTPLLLAYMRGQAPLCKVLIKNGACLGAENREGVTIFNFQLATNQLLHKLLDQLPQESPWATSELCQECGVKFTITMRKHHCRHCGRILCSKCSNNDVPIIKFGILKPVRVCCVCFEVLQVGSQ